MENDFALVGFYLVNSVPFVSKRYCFWYRYLFRYQLV